MAARSHPTESITARQVVHARLQVRDFAGAIREFSAALVEGDQARERRQPLEKATVGRELPSVLDLIRPAARVDEIQRALADDLVGDVEIAALRVSDLSSDDVIIARVSAARW